MSLRPSVFILIAANLLPLAGVLWLDWSVQEVLLLYWTESVIVGFVNVLRIAVSQAPVISKLFLIPFFIVHFGAFCYAHLTAVIYLLGAASRGPNPLSALPPFTDSLFWIASGGILLSHLFSFAVNFIGTGEYRRTPPGELMHRPYSRIMIMHVTIIVGAIVIERLGSPIALLLVMIGAKTVVDVFMHQKERTALGKPHDAILKQHPGDQINELE